MKSKKKKKLRKIFFGRVAIFFEVSYLWKILEILRYLLFTQIKASKIIYCKEMFLRVATCMENIS